MRGTGHIENSTKETYLKNAKQVFIQQFPNNEVFKNNNDDWWSNLFIDFKKECKRSRIIDPAIAETRKSEPLYRDLSVNMTAIRAKYLDLDCVDALSISKSMAKNVRDMTTAGHLSEFNMCRVTCGRGGGAFIHSLG